MCRCKHVRSTTQNWSVLQKQYRDCGLGTNDKLILAKHWRSPTSRQPLTAGWNNPSSLTKYDTLDEMCPDLRRSTDDTMRRRRCLVYDDSRQFTSSFTHRRRRRHVFSWYLATLQHTPLTLHTQWQSTDCLTVILTLVQATTNVASSPSPVLSVGGRSWTPSSHFLNQCTLDGVHAASTC